VREHAREFGLTLQQFVESLGDEDVAPGRGRRDVVRFDHAEVPDEVGAGSLWSATSGRRC